ncbi:AgmX/PglI C-terminal domain-containing protein [Aestuariirhabdus sp. LZHN29]|uniref:AgmX/PglI C-terminal domain-containing protein n=1 Tax=Aestuariirhabdus sp. LZHN29 TaxID=3417462 RepID=UPI003CF98DC6
MSRNALPMQVPLLSWAEPLSQRLFFRSLLLLSLGAFITLFVWVNLFVVLPDIEREELEKVPQRVARMILKKKPPPPPPPPVQVKVEKPQANTSAPAPAAVVKPKPRPATEKATVEEVKQARKVASQSGLMKATSQLAALRNLTDLNKIGATKLKSSVAGQSRSSKQDKLASNAMSGSGGIEVSTLKATGSAQLAGRSTTQVDTPVDLVGIGAGGGSGSGSGPSQRTTEEIQLTFDRHKTSFYALYRSALRKQLGLKGRVVFNLTILPSGQVERCELVSSELGNAALERKLVARILLMDFGEKPVESWTGNYHVDFSPAG